MENKNKIQVIFSPGLWGTCIRWMLDRFSKDCLFKDVDSPWVSNNRVDEFDKTLYNDRFKLGHQLGLEGWEDIIDNTADKIIVTYDKKDLVWTERCAFYRTPGMETEETRYKQIVSRQDTAFVQDSFGTMPANKIVAKELLKIQFHDSSMHHWWNAMENLMSQKEHYKFPVYNMLDVKTLKDELLKVSDRFNLDLEIEDVVINNVVEKIQATPVVQTKDRAHTVLKAIKSKNKIECGNLDIIEQAYIETELEEEHDSLLFPYGTNWFNDTAQINEFIDTYPSYLKHMNPRLPWYKNIKNPYHVKTQIDKSR